MPDYLGIILAVVLTSCFFIFYIAFQNRKAKSQVNSKPEKYDQLTSPRLDASDDDSFKDYEEARIISTRVTKNGKPINNRQRRIKVGTANDLYKYDMVIEREDQPAKNEETDED